MATSDQPSSRGEEVTGGLLEEGEVLELDKVVRKLKSHCKSMEGLCFKTAKQAVPHRHFGLLEVRKASQPLLLVMAMTSQCRTGGSVAMTQLLVFAGGAIMVG